jgi:glycosyltransferase A (GT-A) superfamily protein (DUF2064 family)
LNLRAHPTVRPHALALGVFPRRGVVDRLSPHLGPGIAQDVASALLLDTLGVLSTIPVRHRVVFAHGDDAVTRQTRLPATWREVAQRGAKPGERLAAALDDLGALGAEAVLLVAADGPMIPLSAIYDGLMWLLAKRRVLIGSVEGGGLFALGSAERVPFLPEVDVPLGLAGTADEAPSDTADAFISARCAANGLDVQRLPRSYRVDGIEPLRRLKAEVAAGAFAPQCRKLFERPDVIAALG